MVAGVLFTARAQNKNASRKMFSDDLLVTEINPMHSFGIFSFKTPFYIGAFQTKGSKFSVGYSFGNIWHPQSTVYYPQNLTPEQRQEANSLYITDRSDYYMQQGIQTKQKTFSDDGVLQNLSFTYLMKLAKKGSFIFKLNTHILSGGSSRLHYLASDRFIEKFHTRVGLEDNFGRKQFDFNRAQIQYQDENGKKISIEKGEVFFGTFDIHYYRPIWQKEKRASYFSIQGGAHLILPVNKYYHEVAGGLSTGLLFRKKIGRRFYTDLSGDFSISHYSLISLGNSINMIDRDIHLSGRQYLSFNSVSRRNKVFSFGIINNYQNGYLKGYIFSGSQDKYRDLGVAYLKAGDRWNGTVLSQPVQLSKLTAASMYFFSIETYFFWGFKGKKYDFKITAGEDYLVVNNAPDIQYGFQLTRQLNW
jgi:hypothetical protein